MSTEPRHDLPLAWAEVDLDAIASNYHELQRIAGTACTVWPVVKADAYGHGATAVSRRLSAEGAPRFCVARYEEALHLRAVGIGEPILVFGPPPPELSGSPVAPRIAFAVCDAAHLAILSGTAATTAQPVPIHVKVDVGMGRLGIRPDSVMEFLDTAVRTPGITVEGVFAHLPCADSGAPEPTTSHLACFTSMRTAVRARASLAHLVFHVANSAGLIDFAAARLDAARTGIALYGQQPSLTMAHKAPLHPAMTLKSRILQLKTVPPGTGLSYGHTFKTTRHTRVATIALGYADGYPRHASNKAHMLVGGQPAPILGRVCMDLILLDVTDIPHVQLYDEAVAFGRQGDAVLLPEVLGDMIGTIGYEITTRVGPRVPRVHLP